VDYPILEKSALFQGIPAAEIRGILEKVQYRIRHYEKDEIIFHLMEPAGSIGIILEGRTEAQKSFPNGSQVNVSQRMPGDMIGPAAVFSRSGVYPCDMTALEPVSVMMFRRDELLRLLQQDVRILKNFTAEIASATYMLQQRLELFSYSGIAQKAAFWLLMQARQSGRKRVRIPDSVSRWAMIMNVSRPSLHRELRRLEEDGIIRYAPPFVEITDADALQDVISGAL